MTSLLQTGSPDLTPRHRWQFCMLAACTVSLAGSIWASVMPPDCSSCRDVVRLLGGFSLGGLGVIFYAHLLILLIWKKPSRYVFTSIVLASGVHAALIALLLSRRSFCPSCFLTAAGAFALLAMSLAMDRRNLRRAALILPIAMLGVLIGRSLFASMILDWKVRQLEIAIQRQVETALQREEREPPVPPGTVRLLIYDRPTCSLCKAFKKDVLPVIRREDGARLQILFRPAWKRLPTPTVIVRGKRRMHFSTLPSVEQLRQAIAYARGDRVAVERHGAASRSPQSSRAARTADRVPSPAPSGGG